MQHLRREFANVAREAAGELIIGEVEVLQSRAAIEHLGELAGEVVVGKV